MKQFGKRSPGLRILVSLLGVFVCSLTPHRASAEGVDTGAFVNQKNPGKGTLTFHRDGKSEPVTLGAPTDHYGFGLIFKTSLFPETAEDFKGKYVLELALGNLRPRETQKLPQFSTVALLCKEFPDLPKIFPVILNDGKLNDLQEKALILFSSPQTASDAPDEQRLRDTLFGKAGTIFINPLSLPSTVDLSGQGETVKFKTQTYRLEFKSILGTPFKPGDSQLTGTIEIPVFWPSGSAAEKYAASIASKSLSNVTSVKIPEGITDHKRELSGSTRKNKDGPPPPLPND